MPFKITPVIQDDIPVLTTIQWAALHDNALIKSIYPRGPTSALVEFTNSSYRSALGFPTVHLIKATDEASGQVVAFAKWIIFRQDEHTDKESPHVDGTANDLPGGHGWRRQQTVKAPPDCYSRVLRDWNRVITKTRKGLMANRRHSCQETPIHSLSCYFASYAKDLWVLDILHTHPLHQRKGAGAQLVRWGTDMADNEGFPCYVEASRSALKIFGDRNFEDVTALSINLGKYRDGYGPYSHTIMIRPPYGLSIPDCPPPIPPKSTERQWIPPLEAQISMPEWVERISEAGEDDVQQTSPVLEYTAEARMLDMRASSSPRPSLLDVRDSAGGKSPKLGSDLRSSASTKSLIPSLLEVRPTAIGEWQRPRSAPDGRVSVSTSTAAVDEAQT